MTWKVMQRNAWKDVANLRMKQLNNLYKVATPCMDDHQFKEEENESVGQLSTVCPQNVVQCLYLARIGRADIFWSVNKLARAINKWTKSCDTRLCRLISYIHHTSEYKQFCFVWNTAQQCRLGLFQDSDFARDLEDSKSTSRGILCIFGSHTFVPRSWMCKKQTSASHSSTEAEVISLDAGLHMDGIPALNLWDLVIQVFHSSPIKTDKTKDDRGPRRNLSAKTQPNMRNHIPTKHTNLDPTNIDHEPPNGTHSGPSAMLYVFEDNEAVIKMIIVSRSPTMRHVSRTHRVALDWLFDRINLDHPDSNSFHWHQTSTRRHFDQSKFHTWWMEQSSSFVQHQPFQLHLLRWEFQLAKLPQHNGEEDAGAKRRRRKNCGKIETCSNEPVLFHCDKFLLRNKSDGMWKSGDADTFGETRQQDEN